MAKTKTSEKETRKFRMVTPSKDVTLEYRSVREAVADAKMQAEVEPVQLYKFYDNDSRQMLIFDSKVRGYKYNDIGL